MTRSETQNTMGILRHKKTLIIDINSTTAQNILNVSSSPFSTYHCHYYMIQFDLTKNIHPFITPHINSCCSFYKPYSSRLRVQFKLNFYSLVTTRSQNENTIFILYLWSVEGSLSSIVSYISTSMTTTSNQSTINSLTHRVYQFIVMV